MICKLRLNKKRDSDLLYLYYNDRDFYKKVVQILGNYADGKKTTYSMDNIRKPLRNRENNLSDKKKDGNNVYLNLSIHKKYTNIIEMLSCIKPKQKCDFVKNLVKSSLASPVLNSYFVENSQYSVGFPNEITINTKEYISEEKINIPKERINTDTENKDTEKKIEENKIKEPIKVTVEENIRSSDSITDEFNNREEELVSNDYNSNNQSENSIDQTTNDNYYKSDEMNKENNDDSNKSYNDSYDIFSNLMKSYL